MTNCYRCDKKDLQSRDKWVYQDYNKRVSSINGPTIPLRYLCKTCAIKEKELIIDNIASKMDFSK